MDYLKLCTIEYFSKIFLLIILLTGCKSDDNLKNHIANLEELNNQIDSKGWKIIQNTETDYEQYFFSKKQIRDTSYSLGFSYFKNKGNGFYHMGDYVKSYYTDNYYYEMALLNSDTLYLFNYKKNIMINKPGYSLKYKNMNFIMGKYYYMYTHGKLNWGQKEYFENFKDSLIKTTGNDLPELPDFRLQKEDTTMLTKETTLD